MLLVSIASFTLILLDVVSKLMVMSNLKLYDIVEVIPNFLNITYIKNYGGAFNILDGSRWFFIILGVLSVVFIIKYVLIDHNISKIDMAAYSLVIAGIIGNLVDRIVYGGVIDFLSFRLLGHDFAVFNLADSFIVIGVFLILFVLIFRGDSNENIHSR